jgi:CheY-like chemotaxis protein
VLAEWGYILVRHLTPRLTLDRPVADTPPPRAKGNLSEAAGGLAVGTDLKGSALIVDDDPEALSSFSQLLQLRGITTYGASTGDGAVRSALAHRPDVVVLDNRLGKPGEMTGIDVIDTLHAQGFYPTWILYSGFMEFDLAVDAGRRDVFRVVQLPSTDIETVVMTALTAVRAGQVGGWPILPVGPLADIPQTNVARGARWILIACDSSDDLASFPAWAARVNASEGRMRDLYKQLKLNPHEVKSFMRWFRALTRARGHVDDAVAELSVGDERTLWQLRGAARLSDPKVARISLEQFVRSQTFVAADHALVSTVRSLAATRNLPTIRKR